MTRARRAQALLATANFYTEQAVRPYASELAAARGCELDSVVLDRGTQFWDELDTLLAKGAHELLIVRWPERVSDMQAVARLAKEHAVAVIAPATRPDTPVNRIMVAWGGGPHALDGLDVAAQLARRRQVPAEALRVVRVDERLLQDRQAALDQFRHVRDSSRAILDLMGIRLPVRVRLGEDVVGSLLTRAREDNLIIVGGSNDLLMRHHPTDSIPLEIYGSITSPMIMLLIPDTTGPTIGRVFWERTIRVDMDVADAADAISQLVSALVDERQVPWHRKSVFLEKLIEHCRMRKCVVAHDLAIVHLRLPECSQIIGCMGILRNPVRLQGRPVRLLIVLLTPEERYDRYLPFLSQLARMLDDDRQRADLLRSRTAGEAAAVMLASDGGQGEMVGALS
ncbi:MAG: hypothetical protein BIFFINMI_00623 [Phycisphaerae bacterium]|nr:hypothetical protein [Phycisphaerae bacterium]